MDFLIVVDMQNDLSTALSAPPRLFALVPKVAEKIKGFGGKVIFTRDTHGEGLPRHAGGQAAARQALHQGHRRLADKSRA